MTDSDSNTGDPQPKKLPLIVVLLIACVLLAILYAGVRSLPASFHDAKTLIAFAVALIVLAGASYAIVYRKVKAQIQYVIAFDITLFVVLGFALLISAATRWQAACFTGGAALLGGGFFGLIFGMPLSVAGAPNPNDVQDAAAQAANAAQAAVTAARGAATNEAMQIAQQAQATAQKAAVMTGRVAKHSLLAEAAGTLSKLIAGATLVQITPIYQQFKQASAYISVYLLQDSPANGATLGGAVLLYFTFLGFLSGLFLPAYFMQDFWDK